MRTVSWMYTASITFRPVLRIQHAARQCLVCHE